MGVYFLCVSKEFTNHMKIVIAILLNKKVFLIQILINCNVNVNVSPLKSTSL